MFIALPPKALVVALSVQLWGRFSDLKAQRVERRAITKEFDFIRGLLTRVDNNDATASVVREWIGKAYEGKVMPVEIPKTAVANSSAAEFGTVYDVTRYDGKKRTYKRAGDAYGRVTEPI